MGSIPRAGNVFLVHERQCRAIPPSQWKINLCNISCLHSPPRWSDRFMPHILLIFAANKTVWQVTFLLTAIHNNIYAHKKYIARTRNRTHRHPLLTHGNKSITTTTPTHLIFHYSFYNIWPAIKDEKPFLCCLWAWIYVCLQRVMFFFFTLIIPRFVFLLSPCFMFVLFYIN